MYNIVQCNHTMPTNRPALDWGWPFWRKRGFCTLLVVSALLCGLSGCGGETSGPSPAASEPTNDLSVAAQPSLVATALLTPTATVTATLTDVVTATVIVTPTATVTASTGADAATATKVITATSSKAIITYTVKARDTLIAIASHYSTTVEAIEDANGLESTVIHPGDVLTIPPTSMPSPVPSATATLTPAAPLAATTSPNAAAGSNTSEPPGWALPPWVTQDVTRLAIYTSLLAMFLVAVLLARALGRGRSSPVPPPPPFPPAPISIELAGPPAAGTAYLETRLVATGATLYYPLAQNVISIGRDPSNSIVLDQRFADLDGVSRQHAQIVRTGAVFVAKDLGSANGIWIDHRRSRENVLRDGATLGIGKTQFIFRLNPPRGTA